MDGAASVVFLVADIAFFVAFAASLAFGFVFGRLWLRSEENRLVSLSALSVYAVGCVCILLFALSKTNIGV